jgi:hypothetical protein
MFGRSLSIAYTALRRLGLTRSKSDFSTRFCGRGKTYLRDFELRPGRDNVRVPVGTVNVLRANLCAVVQQVPVAIGGEIRPVIELIDRSAVVAELLTSRSPRSWPGA